MDHKTHKRFQRFEAGLVHAAKQSMSEKDWEAGYQMGQIEADEQAEIDLLERVEKLCKKVEESFPKAVAEKVIDLINDL